MIFAFQANDQAEFDSTSVFNVIYKAFCFKALRASRDFLSLADHYD